ncbi:MAG: riboflavin synthase [Candidatus Cloacimonadota bacterium]|nr:MAG: riboflavin synthase [Candidatus Cloacimonadota bacterium]
MFTGIIENRGKVKDIRRKQNGVNLSIQTQRRNTIFKLGGSIAINGVCLTITDFSVDTFIVDVVKDTLTRTNLSMVRKNDSVNIELPLKVGDRLEGHILEGHIDGTGRIISIIKSGTQTIVKIKIPDEVIRYVIKNGSIGIDGVSLTVKDIKGIILSVTLIPFTVEQTNFKQRKVGDRVNIEVDRMGKYIEKYLKKNIL